MNDYVPYCGMPPLPADLWTRWLLDPWLLIGLGLTFFVGLKFAQHRARFSLGWALVAVLFISPLCAASMALFSARVGQHILLTLVAAPVVAMAMPRLRLPAMPLAFLFAALFWFWHAPAPYQATLESDLVYWAMHISLFAAAASLFVALAADPAKGVPAAAMTGAQMTIYAVMLVVSPSAWHDYHLVTTLPFGIDALADQHLAGGLMWVAGGAFFLIAIGTLAYRFVQDNAREHRPLRAS